MRSRRSTPRPRQSAKSASATRVRLWWFIALAAIAGVVVLALGLKVISGPTASPTVVAEDSVEAPEASSLVASASVEVPDVVGSSLKEARIILRAAGLVASGDETPEAATVVSQQPKPGTVAAPGATVSIEATVAKAPESRKQSEKGAGSTMVVCIDPGHQRRSNNSPEPIGPGAKTDKAKVTGGTTGVSTGLPEYEVALQISMNLKDRLEAQGVKVVMTRTTNDVDLSNSERAAIANRSGADLFVRIHCDGSPDSRTSGITTLYPARNAWTKGFSADSKAAAEEVQAAVVAETGAVDRGTIARSDLAGFNYAKVPSILVECGFMSNSVEDRLLASPHYQDKLAKGIAEGVVSWLSRN